jgi:hypothetical protein
MVSLNHLQHLKTGKVSKLKLKNHRFRIKILFYVFFQCILILKLVKKKSRICLLLSKL